MPDDAPPPLPLNSMLPPVIGSVPPPLPPPPGRPTVVILYRWWCVLFVLLYLSFCILEVLVARGDVEPSMGLMELAVSHDDQKAREEIIAGKREKAPGVAFFTAMIALIYACAAAVPRKPQMWTFGLVIICTTIFPYVVTAGGAIPLIIYWIKPRVKAYFNRRP